MHDTVIRPATSDDLAVVAAIYRHYVHTSTVTFDEVAPDAAYWRQRLAATAEAGLPFLVAERDGELSGYAYCGQWRGKPAYRRSAEDSIYLAADAGGQGIGTALLRRLLDESAKSGVREVVAVIADPGHPASVRLHQRCGFRIAGRLCRIGYKHGQWLDTVLMQCSL